MAHLLFPTQFGVCAVAWQEKCLTGFWLPEPTDADLAQRVALRDQQSTPVENIPGWLGPLTARVQAHFLGQLQDFSDVALDWTRVSDFQRSVYEHTLAIKPGYKKSYGEIARLLGLGPAVARAVGTALGSNPWPLIVPCHRVVAANDKMTGFSGPGGIRTKTRLLALEGAELLSE